MELKIHKIFAWDRGLETDDDDCKLGMLLISYHIVGHPYSFYGLLRTDAGYCAYECGEYYELHEDDIIKCASLKEAKKVFRMTDKERDEYFKNKGDND